MIGILNKAKLFAFTPDRESFKFPKDFTYLSKLKEKYEEAPVVPGKRERSPKYLSRAPKRSKPDSVGIASSETMPSRDYAEDDFGTGDYAVEGEPEPEPEPEFVLTESDPEPVDDDGEGYFGAIPSYQPPTPPQVEEPKPKK